MEIVDVDTIDTIDTLSSKIQMLLILFLEGTENRKRIVSHRDLAMQAQDLNNRNRYFEPIIINSRLEVH